MNSPVEQLNKLALLEFPGYFSRLNLPSPDEMQGLYQGGFVGPAWLRRMAGPLLVLTRMGDWLGKDFKPGGQVINLVRTREGIQQKLPMRLIEQDSLIDGKPGWALQYEASNPFPWPHIVDELRIVEPDLILGMTIPLLGPLARLPLPFVLQPRESMHGF
jgi:hypothetical protein